MKVDLTEPDDSTVPGESTPLTVAVPMQITPWMIRMVREDATTSIEDKDEWYKRLGWLICAWDVLLEHAPRDLGPLNVKSAKEGE